MANGGTATMLRAARVSLLAASLALCGCSRPQSAARAPTSGATPTAPSVVGQRLSGTIRISGAWALYPMVVKWAEEFQKVNPGVRIDVSAGGAGKGAADALGGLADIGMVSRAIHPDEEQRGGWWVPVVKDAVFPTINEKNPVAQLLVARGVKREAFAGIWLTGEVTNWGQVAGSNASEAIHVFTRSDACGAADTWAKYLGKDAKQEDLKGTGVYGDPGLAESVRKDPLAIGYNNLNYAYDTATGRPVAGIRVVPIDVNANGKLDPQESFYGSKQEVLGAILDGRYPSPPARDLNFLCKGKPQGVTAAFVKWVLTEGQQYAEPAGYVALPQEKAQAALRKLE
jgi:phosphate transport system substrate-binding protein